MHNVRRTVYGGIARVRNDCRRRANSPYGSSRTQVPADPKLATQVQLPNLCLIIHTLGDAQRFLVKSGGRIAAYVTKDRPPLVVVAKNEHITKVATLRDDGVVYDTIILPTEPFLDRLSDASGNLLMFFRSVARNTVGLHVQQSKGIDVDQLTHFLTG